MYRFSFSAFDNTAAPDKGYRSRRNEVEVAVLSNTEADALERAKQLVKREEYELDSISEELK